MVTDRGAGYGLLVILLFFFSGCATLPGGKLVPSLEAEQVRTAFRKTLNHQQKCPAGIDADVTATFYGLFSSGSINGYLLTYPPGFLRFEGVNPLGLTENILTTDGHRFSYLLIRQRQAYVGELDSGKAKKYVTPRQAASIASWLLGRLPAAISTRHDIWQDNNGAYWLTLEPGNSTDAARILFSARRGVVERYVTMAGGKHGRLDVSYHYPDSTAGDIKASCLVPDLVTIRLGGHKAISLAIRDAYPIPKLDKKQFAAQIPAAFERINLP